MDHGERPRLGSERIGGDSINFGRVGLEMNLEKKGNVFHTRLHMAIDRKLGAQVESDGGGGNVLGDENNKVNFSECGAAVLAS